MLKAEQINVGIANIDETKGTFELFLKVDPRVVMDELDRKFTSLGWKKETIIENIEGKPVIKCTLSVKTQDGEWVSRDDHSGGAAWAESQEAKVMEADALRRAAVQFGIGRELYTFRNIVARLTDDKGNSVVNYFPIAGSDPAKPTFGSKDRMYVEQIIYDENYNITALSSKNMDVQDAAGNCVRVYAEDRRNSYKQSTFCEKALSDARDVEGDIASLTGRKIGDLSAEEILYLWGNTKTPEVKKACVIVAKNTKEVKDLFKANGVKL